MDAVASQDAGLTFLSSDRIASLSDTVFGVAMTARHNAGPLHGDAHGIGLDMLREMSTAWCRCAQLRDFRRILDVATAPTDDDAIGWTGAD